MRMSITEIEEHLEETLTELRALEKELEDDGELTPTVKRVLRLAREGFHELDGKLGDLGDSLEEAINELL